MTNLKASEIDMTKRTQWPCRGCGTPISGKGGPRYCGPDCRPRCSVSDCDKPVHAKSMCSAHATRAKRYGDPLAPKQRQPNGHRDLSGRVIPRPCAVDDCDRPSRKSGWCSGHYAQWRRYGEAKPFAFTWSDEPDCLICGEPNGNHRSRRFCSAACQQYAMRHGLDPVPNPNCARCGVEIDIMVGTKRRRRIRSDVKLCRRCKAQSRTEATPGSLALRDGPFCQLCGCDVDLLAASPDPMRPSVDHVIPRAWGGSDAAENNQLTHLLCNQIKSDRYLGLSRRSLP